MFIRGKNMKKELWLEFGSKHDDRFEDMLWYNEGNANEIGYFLRQFIKNLFTKNRYFKMRFGKLQLYLRKS